VGATHVVNSTKQPHKETACGGSVAVSPTPALPETLAFETTTRQD
jgi:hypothetical protein